MNTKRQILPDNHDQWPFLSLRDYFAYLGKNDRLLHVEKPVDAKLEMGGISRKPRDEGSDKACIFRNTTHSAPDWHVEPPYQAMVEGVHRNMKMFEDIFDVLKDQIFKNWLDKMTKTHDLVIVKEAHS